jgi:hypothetical protein
MRAFLEKIDGEYLDDFVYISREPLINLGYDIVNFNGLRLSQLDEHKPTTSDIIIGSVQATVYFLKLLEIDAPKYLGYPKELEPFLDRKIRLTTLREYLTKPFHGFPFLTKSPDELDLFNGIPFFIKPAHEIKKFTGSLVETRSELSILVNVLGCGVDDQVYVSEPVNFLSEWRCFIQGGKLQGIQYYAGDYRKYPNTGVIDDIAELYKDSPIAYTLDVGVLDNGITALVEVNDMWAIGSYGFNQKKYVESSILRFKEIIKNGKQ